MLVHFVMLAAFSALCAGCAAPSVDTALGANNPANPDAAAVPFVRPVNVLAEGAAPHASIPPTTIDHGSMAGMKMPGDPQ